VVTQQRLKEIFEYDPCGFLVRKSSGKKSSSNFGKRRYLRVVVDGKARFVHRMIFLYHYGYLPDVIDHIDNDRANNRVENLRECTQQENCLNRAKHSTGKCPAKNVYWNKASNKWSVQVTVQGKRKYLGVYENLELANRIASEARDRFHGAFANHGGLF